MNRILLIMGLFLGGCSFGQWGKDFGGGVVDGASQRADTLAGRLVGGALDTLTATTTRERLSSLIDRLGEQLNKQFGATRDTLLGEYTRALIAELRRDLLGSETREQISAIRNEVLGTRTRALISQIRDELLGDSTRRRADELRDDLLGATTQLAVQAIVDSAMISLVRRYRQDLVPELESQLSFIQKNATELLLLIAGLAIGIIAFVWWQKRKVARILSVLTYQIHEIPDQKSYDELTGRIQKQAKELGVEPELRDILSKQGTIGTGSWSPQKAT